MKLATVNVIEVDYEAIMGLRSFHDNPDGHNEAEELFRKLYKEYNSPENMTYRNPSELELEKCLEDGHFEDENSHYHIYIVHSDRG